MKRKSPIIIAKENKVRNSNHVRARQDIDVPPLYYVTTGLCVFMVGWILVFPSSTFQEHSVWRRQLFDMVVKPDSSAPPEIIKKYAGHYLVQATHILPGVIWAGLIPLQLHPNSRRRKYKRLHRLLGYIFVTTAIVMAYGVWLILHRKLGFEHFFDDLAASQNVSAIEPVLLLLTAYFVATLCVAVYAATQGRIAVHQRFIIRHISSGIWIAVQRIMLVTLFPVVRLGGSFSREEQRMNFSVSGFTAMLITMLAGEYAIYTLHRN